MFKESFRNSDYKSPYLQEKVVNAAHTKARSERFLPIEFTDVLKHNVFISKLVTKIKFLGIHIEINGKD